MKMIRWMCALPHKEKVRERGRQRGKGGREETTEGNGQMDGQTVRRDVETIRDIMVRSGFDTRDEGALPTEQRLFPSWRWRGRKSI